MSNVNLAVNFAGVEMKNPVVTASGTFNPQAHSKFYDLSKLGGVTLKGVADVPWPGNPTPRIAETYGGMLNSVGLHNPGVEVLKAEDLPFMKQFDTKVIVNTAGHSIAEYCRVSEALQDAEGVDLVELNISCPNVKEGGVNFGTNPQMVEEVVAAVKKCTKQPLIVKLSPNVTNIVDIAKAAEAGGADALSLINTLFGMRIDIYRRRPVLAQKMGGFSGPAIKPVAVRMVYQVHKAVNLPLLGMGGIMTGEDAIEFIMAGATIVATGTANLVDPTAPVRIVGEMEAVLEKMGVKDINEIRGVID
ncbi:MAG: dihydroorotate dehydrogenase [Firmicutes bacterium]|nr:dihydroorotate dehydrogenase [Bacillota bacterium]